MIKKFYCHRSERIYKEANHTCLGISPFNSYFSESTIRSLAAWADNNFDSFTVFVPDKPTVYTLEAIGYSIEKSKKQSKKQCKYLKNKIKKALFSVGKKDEEIEEMILDGKKLNNNARFRSTYDKVLWHYNNDSTFQSSCLEASKWALKSKVKDESQLTIQAMQIAVKYFLYEIPIFIDAANIIGKKSSLFCYHQTPLFLEKMYERKFHLKPEVNQGFAELHEVALN